MKHYRASRTLRQTLAVLALMPIGIGQSLAGAHTSPADAEDSSDKPWFGVRSIERRESQSARDRSRILDRSFPPLSIQGRDDDQAYADISGEEIYAYLEKVIEITRAERPEGERFWGRIAGSAAEIATAAWMADEFRELGLEDVRLEDVQGSNQWWPVGWEVTLIGDEAYGPGTEDITFNSAFPAIQLEVGELSVNGLEAELVYVGRGHPVDLLDRDVEGKIAVVHGALQTDPFFQSARGYIDAVVEAGAVGVITVLSAPGNHQYALEDMGPVDTPCFILGGDDGRFLEDAMAAAGPGNPLKIRLTLETEVRDPWRGKNVVGVVPGQSDEYLVIVAHLDGYFDSANDNGAGLASLLALAKHYARPGAAKPQRTHVFVGTAGHHEFSDGVENFIVDHGDMLAKAPLVFNVEHPSSAGSYYRGPLKFYSGSIPGQLTTTTTEASRSLNISNRNDLLASFYREAIDRYGLVINANLELSPPSGDAFGFFKAGHTVVQILDANIWYHSDGDMADTMYPSGLQRATRLYAFVLDKIDQASWSELE